MAFDAFFLSAVLEEVRTRCIGARVEKIHQPARDTIIVHLRCQEGREKLLFAANPAAPRLHLTAASPENPAQPPMFCMLLRKHLLGAKLTEVSQPPMERAASFRFDCTDEMGFPVQKTLVAELMGRTCNLYLLSPEGRILDCLRHIGLDESAKRAALPGLMYQPPEPVMKLNPLDSAPEGDAQRYVNILTAPGADVLADRLMDTVGGLSPLVCREAALYAAGSTDARIDSLDVDTTADKLSLFFHEHVSHPAPYYYALPDGTPKQFAFCPIREYGECRRAESFGKLLDMYYTVRDQKDAMRQKGQAVRKTVQNLCSRLTKKLAIQEKELEATYDRERLRQLGDILTANLHRIVKGQTTVQCEDFYDEEMRPVNIPISPILSPNQNAARYYKDYARMKNAEKELTKQLELGRLELDYLKSVLEELNRAGTEGELEEIRRELQEGGYLRPDTDRKRMKQAKLSQFRREELDLRRPEQPPERRADFPPCPEGRHLVPCLQGARLPRHHLLRRHHAPGRYRHPGGAAGRLLRRNRGRAEHPRGRDGGEAGEENPQRQARHGDLPHLPHRDRQSLPGHRGGRAERRDKGVNHDSIQQRLQPRGAGLHPERPDRHQR